VSTRPFSDADRERFDRLVEDAIDALPAGVRALLDEISVVVLDEPTGEMLRDLGIDAGDADAKAELCGLHTGIALTERSVEFGAELPPQVHLFRRGIVELAGGWKAVEEMGEDGEKRVVGGDDEIYEEIRITLLHEIGHHFGLDEDDLERLGYD
jgi:predicted Zn-dependent protease with MMP-like domain